LYAESMISRGETTIERTGSEENNDRAVDVGRRDAARRHERSYQVDERSAAVFGEHPPMLAERACGQCITSGLVSRAS
jgi:hypothetical protein